MQVQLWAKLCDKERCYWEHLGEHGENVIGNAWTHVENILGNTLATWWEHQYPKKLTHTTFSLSPTPAPKGKKMGPPMCMLNHEVSFLK
jgi:hypothetical protein